MKEVKEDTNGEENLLETRNRPDSHDAVTNLSLWGRVGKQNEGGKGGGTCLNSSGRVAHVS